MRVVKEANERKNEILDAAAMLFAEKGFDNTSTNEILEAVGIARGTLYHHFKSKEDIMDAIIDRQSGRMLARARQIAEDDSIPVEERMIRVVTGSSPGRDGRSGRERHDQTSAPASERIDASEVKKDHYESGAAYSGDRVGGWHQTGTF